MNWINFPVFAILSATLWLAGIVLLFLMAKNEKLKLAAHTCIILGIAVLAFFILLLWIKLQRPPMRTLGETRLWYSLFLIIIGYLVFLKRNYLSVFCVITGFSILFLCINIQHPETYEKNLMPALQSPYFIPHVVVYILSYAFLGFSWIIAVVGLVRLYIGKFEVKIHSLANEFVYLGFSLLTLGMVFGALWAKEAWGHYWTWDPKETWAFLTWLVYLIYIHFRYYHPKRIRIHLWILGLIFVVLLMCWFGINYLPAAQNSVHVYAQ